MPFSPKKSEKIRFFSLNESKAWGDKFFLLYSFFWIPFMAWIVYTKFYEGASKWGWFYMGLVQFIPPWIIPLIFPGKADKNIPIVERYWFKANVWIFIFGFVGNYFWTHYFYKVLGAYYTFKTFELNHVPYTCYFITHAYFTFYHSLTNVIQRVYYSMFKNSLFRKIGAVILIAALAYITAFMEAFTIQHFPYYVITDRRLFYIVGSAFYGLYFIVSFPMFYSMDEDPRERRWTLYEVVINALGSAMLVTILLDFWRIGIGGIVNIELKGLPWM